MGEPHPPRILVAEDQACAREAMAALLEDCGYDVVAVADGGAAMTAFKEQLPDLVISDVVMPGTSGFNLVTMLRSKSQWNDIPIILISALDHSARRVAGLDMGADDFLPKPLDANELLARVRVHLRHHQRRRKLIELSTIDDLTGILNRRGILEVLDRERERAHRLDSKLSLIMVDIDDFKQTNDRCGHAAGDEVLRNVAAALESSVRSADRVGRIGGDEFLMVLPDTDEGAADALANRLHIAAHPTKLSVGSATALATETGACVLARADEAMYAAKRYRHARSARGQARGTGHGL